MNTSTGITPAGPHFRRFLPRSAALLTVGLLTIGRAGAADVTWTGATSGIWDTTTVNWSGDSTVFTSGDNALFSGTPTNNVTAASGLTIGSIDLQSGFTGSVALTGANTVNGTTTVSAGTLYLGNNGSLGTSTVTLAGGSVIANAGIATTNGFVAQAGTTSTLSTTGVNWNFNGNLSGAGNITRTYVSGGAATLYLGGDNSGYTGTFTMVNHDRAVVRFATTSSGSANAKWVFNQAVNNTRTTLDFANGTISFGSFTGNGYLTSQGGAGTRTIEVGALNLDESFSGVIGQSGTGVVTAVTKTGSGVWTLSGTNTYTGGTVVNDGTLVLAKGGGAGTVRGALTINAGATVNTTASDALGYTSGQQVSTVNVIGGTFNNSVSANQGFLTNFALTGGTVSSSGGGAINFSSGLSITSNASSSTSTWSAPIVIRLDSASNLLTADVADGSAANDLIISGAISENTTSGRSGAFTKNGAGTLVLSSTNTYTGATTVSAGTLSVTGSLASGSAVSVSSGATLRGTGTIGGATTIASGGSLAAGVDVSTLGTLTFNSTLDTTGATVFLKLNSTTGTADLFAANGLTLGDATLSISDLGSGTWTPGNAFTIFDNTSGSSVVGTFAGLAEGGSISVGSNIFTISYLGGTGNDITLTAASAIPEPSTYAAIVGALALAGVVWQRRRRAA